MGTDFALKRENGSFDGYANACPKGIGESGRESSRLLIADFLLPVKRFVFAAAVGVLNFIEGDYFDALLASIEILGVVVLYLVIS